MISFARNKFFHSGTEIRKGIFISLFVALLIVSIITISKVVEQPRHTSNINTEQQVTPTYKQVKVKSTGKIGATDIPSWAKGKKPYVGESGNDYAKRLLDGKYGKGNYTTGPRSEFNRLRKYADRHFE